VVSLSHDRILLSAGASNIEAVTDYARRGGYGIELMTFAFGHNLDAPDLPDIIGQHRQLLEGIPRVHMHGPFIDMVSGSADAAVNALTRTRYQQALAIAEQLGVTVVVFHANFIAALRHPEYRATWLARNIEFWSELQPEIEARRATVAIENMFEFEPQIIIELLAALDHPRFRACLDVGHTHLFSEIPLDRWLDVCGPYIVHCHLNNNDGVYDYHKPLGTGVLDYAAMLPRLEALPLRPTFTLEMDTLDDMRASLPLLVDEASLELTEQADQS
jgi:sugar phosphate isomerase/epimerase